MHIAGGVYRELCDVPSWDAELGSGGRAAAAVSALSPETVLHTYATDPNSTGITALRALGVDVIAHPSSTPVAFAYFHPLSRPHIEPPVGSIAQQPAIPVAAEATLRFGFLEGGAVVTGKSAIYDPQTSNDPPAFGANGSRVDNLAVVANELEVRAMAGAEDLHLSAERVMNAQGAAVVVVKAGTRGAFVFEAGRGPRRVPPYMSSRVFKIGTGDVFSAMFAHQWSEKGQPADKAADLASRSVAAYCATRELPVQPGALERLRPIGTSPPGPIRMEGAVNTLGRRYVMEEARFRLGELGAQVICESLDGTAHEERAGSPAAVLMIADGSTPAIAARTRSAHIAGVPVVVLAEEDTDESLVDVDPAGWTRTNDFASAIYFAVWAAIAGRGAPPVHID